MARKIATADVVDLSELLDFIRPRHRMVLTTFRAGGVPAEFTGHRRRGRPGSNRRRVLPAAGEGGQHPSQASGQRGGPVRRFQRPVRAGGRPPQRSSTCPKHSRAWSSTSGPSRASIPTGTSTARRWWTSASADQGHAAAVGGPGGHWRISAAIEKSAPRGGNHQAEQDAHRRLW